jgi:hypothetical protein
MAFTFEGKLEIPLEEFYSWAGDNYGLGGVYERCYGVPTVNKDNHTIEISFAGSDTSNPAEWREKPKAALEWKEQDIPNY